MVRSVVNRVDVESRPDSFRDDRLSDFRSVGFTIKPEFPLLFGTSRNRIDRIEFIVRARASYVFILVSLYGDLVTNRRTKGHRVEDLARIRG